MDLGIREASPPDAKCISDLIRKVFMDSLAHQFTPDGGRVFLSFIEPGNLSGLLGGHLFGYIAEVSGEVVGVILFKDPALISLFFVSGLYRGRGVGTALLGEGILSLKRRDPRLPRIRVNSVPSAVGTYERLGFRTAGKERVVEGIRFIPMEMDEKGMSRYLRTPVRSSLPPP